MLELDINTLIFVLISGHIISLIFVIFYLKDNNSNKYDYIFIFGKILQIIAWSLISLRGEISDVVSLILGNMFLFCGFAFEALAVTSIKIRFKKRGYYIHGGLFMIVLLIWSNIIFKIQLEIRMSIVMVFVALFFLIFGCVLVFSNKKTSSLQKLLGMLYMVYFGVFLCRAIGLLYLPSYNLYVPEYVQVISFICLYFILLTGSLGYILVKKELTDRELIKMASVDYLTEVYNRRAFIQKVNKEAFSSSKEGKYISLLMIDIDFFKKINDEYGHQVGDIVLKHIAIIMKNACRKNDIIGRYGGEEFVIFLPDTELSDAVKLAERLRVLVESTKIEGIEPIKNTISIGCSSVILKENFNIHQIISCSDLALYKAKELGRNRIEVNLSGTNQIA